jgi:hypothetical protein
MPAFRLPSTKQERKAPEPKDLTNERHDGWERCDRTVDREGEHDGEAEILERSEGNEGHVIFASEAKDPSQDEQETPDSKRPGQG